MGSLELHNLKIGPSVVIPVHDTLYITATPFSLNSGSLDLYAVAVIVCSFHPADPVMAARVDPAGSGCLYHQYKTGLFHFRLL